MTIARRILAPFAPNGASSTSVMCALRHTLVGLAAITSCAAPPPPQPPPFAGEAPQPAVTNRETSPDPMGDPRIPVPALTDSVRPAPPAAPSPPALSLVIEPAFRLDRRIIPSTQEAFLLDLKDRTAWNQGALGTLSAPLPPVPGHPAPKVIVDVHRASGGLGPNQSQAALRSGIWGKIVSCYGLSAYKDQKLRGAASFNITVAPSGKVTGARTTKSGFRDPELPRCLESQLRAFTLPKSKRKSAIALEIQVGHGDEPMPPPPSLAVPGEGTLTPEEMRVVVESARPAFEDCYRSALEYAPELWGRLGLRFHVTEKGKTDEVFEVESRFPDERVSLCVLRAARKLTFPAPAGGELRFVVPLRFSSAKSLMP